MKFFEIGNFKFGNNKILHTGLYADLKNKFDFFDDFVIGNHCTHSEYFIDKNGEKINCKLLGNDIYEVKKHYLSPLYVVDKSLLVRTHLQNYTDFLKLFNELQFKYNWFMSYYDSLKKPLYLNTGEYSTFNNETFENILKKCEFNLFKDNEINEFNFKLYNFKQEKISFYGEEKGKKIIKQIFNNNSLIDFANLSENG